MVVYLAKGKYFSSLKLHSKIESLDAKNRSYNVHSDRIDLF